MDYKDILYETRDHVARITINRPKTLNALDIPTVQALDKAFGALEADAAVRVENDCTGGPPNRTYVGDRLFCCALGVAAVAQVLQDARRQKLARDPLPDAR